MKNLFDTGVADEIRHRIHSVNATSAPQWGKMNVAQMLAHCQRPMEMAMGEIPMMSVGFFMKLFGRMIKGVITSPKPYKHSLPTAPSYVTTASEYDFVTQKEKLLRTLDRYILQEDKVVDIPHPIFGKLTKEEWGISQYKHLDHHLSQFSV